MINRDKIFGYTLLSSPLWIALVCAVSWTDLVYLLSIAIPTVLCGLYFAAPFWTAAKTTEAGLLAFFGGVVLSMASVGMFWGAAPFNNGGIELVFSLLMGIPSALGTGLIQHGKKRRLRTEGLDP
jgi:hypothetical protein